MTIKSILLILVASFSTSAAAVHVSFDIGESSQATAPQTKNITLGHVMAKNYSLFGFENISPFLELNYWQWENYTEDIEGASIAPGLKISTEIFDINMFIKFGIGIAYIDATKWYARKLGDNWIFEDKLEAGVNISANQALVFTITHYSNAALNKNNDSINVLSLGYEYTW